MLEIVGRDASDRESESGAGGRVAADVLGSMFAAEAGAHRLVRQQSLERVFARVLDRPEQPLRLGRYILSSPLGEGGCGTVFAAYDPELDRHLAIKLVRERGAASERIDSRRRLLREAQALARFSHPNVVAVFDVGIATSEPRTGAAPANDGVLGVFLAMERIDGVDLARWLRAEPRSASEVIAVFVEAGRGLAAAHDNGIVHRDFKPANVLVGHDGRVCVADFGLARTVSVQDYPTLDEQSSAVFDRAAFASDTFAVSITEQGAAPGTPRYMAPEQRRGQFTPASDQWSFCLSLYESLIARGAPSFPPEIKRVLGRGLASDPARRYHDMNALLRAIERQGRPVRRARRAIVFTVAAVACGIAGFTAASRPACAEDRDVAARIWTAERQAKIHRAFLDTRATFAEDAWTTVEARVGAWANAWTRAHGDRDASDPCLEHAAVEMDAVLHALEDADAVAVERAPSAVMQLALPARCDDARETPDVLAGSDRVSAALANARALELAGRYDAALTVTSAILDDELGEGATAQALARRGSIREQLGDYEGARADLTEAIWLARANDFDGIAIGAATRLVFLLGSRLADTAEAERWAHDASALLVRSPSARGEADLVNAVCTMHIAARQLDAGVEACERAAALREDALGADHPDVASSTSNAAIAHQLRGDFAVAIELDERALAIRTRVFGPSHPQIAHSLNNLGATKANAGDDEAALIDLRRALAIREAALGPEHSQTLTVLDNIALSEARLGHFAIAERDYRRVLDARVHALGSEHLDTATTWNGLGNVAWLRADWNAALDAHRRALEIRSTLLGSDHVDTAQSMINTATALFETGDVDAALTLARDGVAVRQRVLGEHVHTVEALVLLADIELAAGGEDRALVAAHGAVRIAESVKDRDARGLVPAREVLAKVEAARRSTRGG